MVWRSKQILGEFMEIYGIHNDTGAFFSLSLLQVCAINRNFSNFPREHSVGYSVFIFKNLFFIIVISKYFESTLKICEYQTLTFTNDLFLVLLIFIILSLILKQFSKNVDISNSETSHTYLLREVIKLCQTLPNHEKTESAER